MSHASTRNSRLCHGVHRVDGACGAVSRAGPDLQHPPPHPSPHTFEQPAIVVGGGCGEAFERLDSNRIPPLSSWHGLRRGSGSRPASEPTCGDLAARLRRGPFSRNARPYAAHPAAEQRGAATPGRRRLDCSSSRARMGQAPQHDVLETGFVAAHAIVHRGVGRLRRARQHVRTVGLDHANVPRQS